MKFLLHSINYSPELTGIGKYNGELASELATHDVDVHVLTAPPYYPEWKRHTGYKNRYSIQRNAGVTVYRCPLYVPSDVTTLKRLLHLFSFAVSSALRLLTLIRLRPDVVFLVQPTLFCAPFALLYSKIVGAKTVLHIQDFEVDAMFGLGMAGGSEAGAAKRLVRRIESWLMNRFDRISSISYSMLENAERKGVPTEKQLFFPNWSDTDFVHPDIDASDLRQRWGYSPEDKLVLYSGNMGKKQGLEIILEAAKALGQDDKVKFIIIGSGVFEKTLKAMVKDQRLTNVTFKPLQPWEDVPKILVMADVHLVVQKRGAADAVLPSKLTNILAAGGHALVTAEEFTELGKIEKKFNGIYQRVEPENVDDFIDGLKILLASDTRKPNSIARQYAVNNLNQQAVIGRFAEDVKNICMVNT